MVHLDESRKLMAALGESTKQQIDNFVAQTEEIAERLEDVADKLHALSQLTGEIVQTEKELKQIEENKIRQREADLRRQEQETRNEKERYKPKIYLMLIQEISIINMHQMVKVYNGGGDASALRLNIEFRNPATGKIRKHSFSSSTLKRSFEVKFETNRISHLLGFDNMLVELFVWDANQREYRNNSTWARKEYEWILLEAGDSQNVL